MVVQASADVVLFHLLTLKAPHVVSVLLLQNKMMLLSRARQLACVATLTSQPHIMLERCTTLNPATLLPSEEDGESHNCLEWSKAVTSPRPDLKDAPLLNSQHIFVDGSSQKWPNGTNATGCAVVTKDKVLKAEQLPSHYSAQAEELVALTEACKLAEGKRVAIWTDSILNFTCVCITMEEQRHENINSKIMQTAGTRHGSR